jgi:hypothetical protein
MVAFPACISCAWQFSLPFLILLLAPQCMSSSGKGLLRQGFVGENVHLVDFNHDASCPLPSPRGGLISQQISIIALPSLPRFGHLEEHSAPALTLCLKIPEVRATIDHAILCALSYTVAGFPPADLLF